MQCYEFRNNIQWVEYYYIMVTNVLVPLSRVTHPNIKQIDHIFSYIIIHAEE